MIQALLIGLQLTASTSLGAEPVDAAEVYAIIHKFGRPIRATTFSNPQKTAFAVEAAGCYIGAFDFDQKFQTDAKGRLVGKNAMCQVLDRKNGRQRSFIDAGCSGATILAEGAPESEFRGALKECSQKLLGVLLGASWNQYITASAVAKRGWNGKKVLSVDMSAHPKSGRVSTQPGRRPVEFAKAQEHLDELGRAYDGLYGRAELERLALQSLWAYAGGDKVTALEVFQKASWWKAAKEKPAQKQEKVADDPQGREDSKPVPLLR